MCWCVLVLPPLIFIGGDHGLLGCELKAGQLEMTSGANGKTPCGRSKAVELEPDRPARGSAGLVRPPTDLPFGGEAGMWVPHTEKNAWHVSSLYTATKWAL